MGGGNSTFPEHEINLGKAKTMGVELAVEMKMTTHHRLSPEEANNLIAAGWCCDEGAWDEYWSRKRGRKRKRGLQKNAAKERANQKRRKKIEFHRKKIASCWLHYSSLNSCKADLARALRAWLKGASQDETKTEKEKDAARVAHRVSPWWIVKHPLGAVTWIDTFENSVNRYPLPHPHPSIFPVWDQMAPWDDGAVGPWRIVFDYLCDINLSDVESIQSLLTLGMVGIVYFVNHADNEGTHSPFESEEILKVLQILLPFLSSASSSFSSSQIGQLIPVFEAAVLHHLPVVYT